MNDDFLYRIRAEPSPRFVASLKERLNQLEKAPKARLWAPRRSFFVGSLITGAALATGLFVSRTMYNPPVVKMVQPMPTANPTPADEQLPGLVPRATGSTKSAAVITSEGKAAGANSAAGQLGVGATVALYPSIKEAARFMNKNMNVYPPFPEPTFTMMSSDVVFPSLCAIGNSVDAVVVDRRVLPEELNACRRSNKHITEVKFGYEAIVLAHSNLYDAPKLSTRSIFLALAREIPNPSNPEELIKNPNVTWDQVDSALPNERIDVAGPPPSAATGIAFRDLILKTGCSAMPTIASLKERDPVRFEEVCGSVRTDGVYRVRELSSDDLVGYLQANPEAIALLSYKEMSESLNLAAGSIDGVTPSRSIIYSGSYVGARVLYLYANTAVPHMREFVWAICSSVGGASADTPLIAIDAAEQRSSSRQQVLTLPDLKF